MKSLITAVFLASVISLAGCGGNGSGIVDQVQAGVVRSCSFLADYKWLTDVVSKMDITAATVNAAVTAICLGVGSSSSQPLGILGDGEKRCVNGEIVVNDETVCIEGEKIDP